LKGREWYQAGAGRASRHTHPSDNVGEISALKIRG